MTSDGGTFALYASGMTGAVEYAVPATKSGLTRAEEGDGPQGSEANGDELMTSEVGHLWPANGV